LTDTLPNNLAYVQGSLVASLGTVDDNHLPELRWSGVMGDIPEVVVSYRAIVTTPVEEIEFINNTAILRGIDTILAEMQAYLVVNGETVFLPVISR
jgi:hypothetical protein